MNRILTKESVRCFTGSDFTAKDIITSGEHPKSVFLNWPEKDLLSLSPLIQLVLASLLDGMIDAFDAVKGKGCSPVLVVLDEIFRIGFPKLSDYTTTVCGRDITLLVPAQSKSQLDAKLGKFNAEVFRGQFDTAVFYPPAPLDHETSKFIEESLYYTSGFAHSKNEHEGGTSTGENEQRIPLLPAHEIELLKKTKVIIKRAGLRPVIADRLDWRKVPELKQRANMPSPDVSELPPAHELLPDVRPRLEPLSSWHFSPNLYQQQKQPMESTEVAGKKHRNPL